MNAGLRALALATIGFVSIVVSGCGDSQAPKLGAVAAEASGTTPVDAFLARHWARPLASQGLPPRGLRMQEASLSPGDCGACHAAQYEDWRRSLHSRAMGPGVLGQLAATAPGDRESLQACVRCHAPLAEQLEGLAAAVSADDVERAASLSSEPPARPAYAHGLTCAGCHVRGYRWFGPPRRDGTAAAAAGQTGFPHGGWTAEAAFEDSRFCATCHQFAADDFALNGKFLENTFEEWKASRYAREGRQCQSCHMLDRRHLWRGIHDPDMVKQALRIEPAPSSVKDRTVVSSLTIKNIGAGHYFPTYVTPAVLAEGFQEDAAGNMLPGTLRQHVIGRQVTLDLSKELSDTRIAPDAEAVFEYRAPLHRSAVALSFRIRVDPDAFYRGLYRSLLHDDPDAKGSPLVRGALRAATDSVYTAYSSRELLRASQ
jgi:cytochrome c554/c'-like protein